MDPVLLAAISDLAAAAADARVNRRVAVVGGLRHVMDRTIAVRVNIADRLLVKTVVIAVGDDHPPPNALQQSAARQRDAPPVGQIAAVTTVLLLVVVLHDIRLDGMERCVAAAVGLRLRPSGPTSVALAFSLFPARLPAVAVPLSAASSRLLFALPLLVGP